MFFYFFIICVASVFAGGASCFLKQSRLVAKTMYVMSALTLFLPLAMRGMGVDYNVYVATYSSVSDVSWVQYWTHYDLRPEPLYVILNFVAKWIFGNFSGVNFLCALVSISFTYAGIWKYKEKVNLGLTIYTVGFSYYIMMYGLNKMMLAVSIITWAYHYYTKKRFWKYLFLTVVASAFHYSALIMIPLYYVMNKMNALKEWLKNPGRIKVIVWIAAIFVAIYYVFPRAFGSMPWFNRYSGYFSLGFTPGALLNNAHLFFCAIISYHYRNRLKKHLKDSDGLYSMMIVFILLAAGSVIMPIHRVCFFMFPCASIMYGAIPVAFKSIFYRKVSDINKILYYCIVIAIGILWLYYFLEININWGAYLVPYFTYS